MTIEGTTIIGNQNSSTGTVGIQAQNPNTGEKMYPLFYKTTLDEVNLACKKAAEAFTIYRKKSGKEKAEFLEAIATEIENIGDALFERYVAESGLPLGRAQGERGRTLGQLRLFAGLLKEGSWVNARIDTALPDRQPLARPDIRSMERPLGPVGVFGASNFPLAFSVAGGDTVSALAAGNPVVFKAHPSHLGLSELVGKAIQKASKNTNMPDGTFSLLIDDGFEVGQALVMNPAIKAVGFTGSFRGGKALFDLANSRPDPIPVYAEMGSTNPVFVLPEFLETNKETFAQNYINSVTMGVGQFCTNPGVLVCIEDAEFIDILKQKTANSSGGVMLNAGIQNTYIKEIDKRQAEVKLVSEGIKPEGHLSVSSSIFECTFEEFISNPKIQEEIFGPTSIVVNCKNKDQMLEIAKSMSGQLTATIHANGGELNGFSNLVDELEQKVGRLIFNGFPTGVEVCHAMVHGGPFPATTAARTTSVGTSAITRYSRPVCYQDLPNELLPDELKSENPLGIWRLTNGEFGK